MQNQPDLDFLEDAIAQQIRRKKINWSLVVGLFIIFVITFLAVIGPQVAPKDPLEEVLIIKVGDEWQVPPFRLFTPGYPLGSDQFGRDLWSRLLWAIKPTLTMVVVVGLIRLGLGVGIGLLAGWKHNRFSRFLDNLIETALSIPVLLVALGAIALIGTEYGIWAFIIGLSMTGWVESAQQVREQTRIIKGQEYIEAARALGSSSRQILLRHVLRQIMPMVLMLLAFELSSTLMTTAGLGFLGYYIGGDVWITVSDFVARRISGTPELGQMLATSWASLTQPWAMIVVGSTIFFTVLGFNLIGEGLRKNLEITNVRRGVVGEFREKVFFALDQYFFYPLQKIWQITALRWVSYAVLLGFVIWYGGVQFMWPRLESWLEEQKTRETSEAHAGELATQTPVEESQIQPSTTENTPHATVPEYEARIVWEVSHAAGFDTSAILDPDRGIFYVGSGDQKLLAFNLEGELLWEVELPARPFHSGLLVGEDGTIFVPDRKAGVTAVSPDGEVLWQFTSRTAENTVAGLVWAPDGNLLYTVSDYNTGYIQAISPAGEDLWVIDARTGDYYAPLRVSADGKYIFLRNKIFRFNTMEAHEVTTNLNPVRYEPGADGINYLLSGQVLLQVNLETEPLEILDGFQFNASETGFAFSSPENVAVSPAQVARYLYTTPGGSTGIVWVSLDDQLLGTSQASFSAGQIIAEISHEEVVVCGGQPFTPEFLTCALMTSDQEAPAWTIELGNVGPAFPGFWENETIFLPAKAGKLYAIQYQHVKQGAETIATPLPPTSSSGVAWSYPLQTEIHYGPVLASDGSVFLITEDMELIILNSQGLEKYRGLVYKEWFAFERNTGWRDLLYPSQLDGAKPVLISFSTENTVYAQDSSGEVVWEVALENPLDDYPYWSGQGNIYLVDTRGKLYALNAEGLRWTFTPQIAERPGSGLSVSPDGTVYYTLTDLTRGYIQAVSAEGEALWHAEIHTSMFYDPLSISKDGQLLFIDREIYSTVDGHQIQADFPFEFREFVIGEDGSKFVQTADAIIQWELGPEGITILNTASLAGLVTNNFPPFIRVGDDGIIMLYVFSGGANDIVFMQPDGKILARHESDPRELTLTIDPQTQTLKKCQYSAGSLECGIQSLATDQFEVKLSVPDIPEFLSAGWHSAGENTVFITTREGDLLQVNLVWP